MFVPKSPYSPEISICSCPIKEVSTTFMCVFQHSQIELKVCFISLCFCASSEIVSIVVVARSPEL